jgi:hypothetical protein
MSRYFNDFGAMSGESLEHGFGEKAHKYIDKVKTKSGKWRYIYKKKMAEALERIALLKRSAGFAMQRSIVPIAAILRDIG